MTKSVLISGASVAGPTTAYWLANNGWNVTVVERSESLRLGGQNIDITDAARDVVRKMGIEDAIKQRHTGEKGLQFVDTNNNPTASFPTDKKGSLTREIEILRGDLVNVLAESTPDSVEYRFGTSIDKLADQADGVTVTFDDGREENYDLLVVADGMNSSTRSLVLDEADHQHYLGCWSSYFTVPRLDEDNNWWRWYTSPIGIIAFLRPDNHGTMRASVNFLSDENAPPHMSLENKKKRLRDRLRGAGWECDRLADDLDGVDDIFLGPLHQIKAKTWWNGHCVLVGDAAYCPTPYTGMGTTLAIIGAYVLANELVDHKSCQEAFAAYEKKFRDFAEKSQKLPPGVPDLAYAQSRFKVRLINIGASIAASDAVQTFASLFDGGKKNDENDFRLPDYEKPKNLRLPAD